MSFDNDRRHHYDRNGDCLFCRKTYEPNSVDFCPGYTLPSDYGWGAPKCECGSKALLPSDQNCHSNWCPCYKKP